MGDAVALVVTAPSVGVFDGDAVALVVTLEDAAAPSVGVFDGDAVALVVGDGLAEAAAPSVGVCVPDAAAPSVGVCVPVTLIEGVTLGVHGNALGKPMIDTPIRRLVESGSEEPHDPVVGVVAFRTSAMGSNDGGHTAGNTLPSAHGGNEASALYVKEALSCTRSA